MRRPLTNPNKEIQPPVEKEKNKELLETPLARWVAGRRKAAEQLSHAYPGQPGHWYQQPV